MKLRPAQQRQAACVSSLVLRPRHPLAIAPPDAQLFLTNPQRVIFRIHRRRVNRDVLFECCSCLKAMFGEVQTHGKRALGTLAVLRSLVGTFGDEGLRPLSSPVRLRRSEGLRPPDLLVPPMFDSLLSFVLSGTEAERHLRSLRCGGLANPGQVGVQAARAVLRRVTVTPTLNKLISLAGPTHVEPQAPVSPDGLTAYVLALLHRGGLWTPLPPQTPTPQALPKLEGGALGGWCEKGLLAGKRRL